MVLKTFLTQHPSGLYAVCGAESPGRRRHRHAPRTSAGCSPRWPGSSATSSSTPRPGLSEQTLAALDRATDVVMLTQHGRPRRPRAAQGARRAARAVHDPGRPARGHELRRPQGRAVGARRRDDDRHRRRRRPAAVDGGAGVDQPGRAAAQSGRRRDPMAKELRPARVALRRHPARCSRAGPGAEAPGGRPDEPRRPPGRRPAAARRAAPARAGAPRPSAVPGAARRPSSPRRRRRRPTPSPGSRTGWARRCSSAWAAG